MRLVTATALALVVAATPTAGAAPTAAWCAGVTDAAGDATLLGAVGAGSALDLLSADAATGRTEVVAVLRLPSTDTSKDTVRAVTSYAWQVAVTVDGLEYVFRYRVNSLAAAGTGRASASVGSATPPVTITVKPTTLIWRIKRSDLPTPGPTSEWIEMRAASYAGGFSADTAAVRIPRSGCR